MIKDDLTLNIYNTVKCPSHNSSTYLFKPLGLLINSEKQNEIKFYPLVYQFYQVKIRY